MGRRGWVHPLARTGGFNEKKPSRNSRVKKVESLELTFEQRAALQDMENRAMLAREAVRQYTEMRRQNMEFLMNIHNPYGF